MKNPYVIKNAQTHKPTYKRWGQRTSRHAAKHNTYSPSSVKIKCTNPGHPASHILSGWLGCPSSPLKMHSIWVPYGSMKPFSVSVSQDPWGKTLIRPSTYQLESSPLSAPAMSKDTQSPEWLGRSVFRFTRCHGLRLFQHTWKEHTPSNHYQQAISRDSFHSWLVRRIAKRVCDIGVTSLGIAGLLGPKVIGFWKHLHILSPPDVWEDNKWWVCFKCDSLQHIPKA